MKKMKIEKQLLFADHVREVASLQVKDGLSYHQEQEGIRAIGPLYIQGVYVNEEGERQQFQETLEMDVLAPIHKLSHTEFRLRVHEFHAAPSEDGIDVTIMMEIQGLLEDGESAPYHTVEATAQPMIPEPAVSASSPVLSTAATESIMERIRPVPSIERIPSPVAQSAEEEETEAASAVVQEEDQAEFEDLFEDAGTTYTSYRMIVARANDTYASIAQRYEVSEPDLMRVNHDKVIAEKSLIILPAVTQEG